MIRDLSCVILVPNEEPASMGNSSNYLISELSCAYDGKNKTYGNDKRAVMGICHGHKPPTRACAEVTYGANGFSSSLRF